MLTEKDYCDYDTCVALKELGFPQHITEEAYIIDNYGEDECDIGERLPIPLIPDYMDVVAAPTLYEAQKWLREEEGLFVNVELFGDYDRDADGKTLGTWVYYSYGILNTTTADFIREYDLCTEYQTYEEALSEGINEAVKILKNGLDSKR